MDIIALQKVKVMSIHDLISYLEAWAPPALQESYDNAGLIVGDPRQELNGVLICLDVTEEVLDEALSKSCNLVIAHHPLIFGGIKKITGRHYTERCLIKAIKEDIAIFAMHTNLDSIGDGVSAALAKELGLRDTRILEPKNQVLEKLYTFVPHEHAGALREALFEAGAGHIGAYDRCSFNCEGTGTFRGLEESRPFAGKKGEEHHEAETKVEVIFPAWIRKRVLAALFESHPYEEVAYDIVALQNEYAHTGFGMIGKLGKEMKSREFLQFLKERLGLRVIRHTPFSQSIRSVALCGGSGSFLLDKAIAAGADAFISGDFKYHRFFDADSKIMICDIGHFESEQFTMQLIYEKIRKKFPNFALHLTSVDTNPIKYYY